MTPAELLDKFRLQIDDTYSEYLWSDDEVYEYMADAQNMFLRLVGGISDSTSAITQITATQSVPTTTVSDRILKFRRADRTSDYVPIKIMNLRDLDAGRIIKDDYGRQLFGNGYKLDATEGKIQAMITDMEQDSVRWVPIPEANETVRLVVYRLSLKDAGETTAFEIHSHHHIHLLKWMMYRAHTKQDAEAFDKGRANTFKREFENYAEGIAKDERGRREHKNRVMRYGGL